MPAEPALLVLSARSREDRLGKQEQRLPRLTQHDRVTAVDPLGHVHRLLRTLDLQVPEQNDQVSDVLGAAGSHLHREQVGGGGGRDLETFDVKGDRVLVGEGNELLSGGAQPAQRKAKVRSCLLYTSPSPRDGLLS